MQHKLPVADAYVISSHVAHSIFTCLSLLGHAAEVNQALKPSSSRGLVTPWCDRGLQFHFGSYMEN